MQVHKSVDQFYQYLRDLNPTVGHFKQITLMLGMADIAKELGLDSGLRMDDNSLIFQGTCEALEHENGVPVSISEYRILFLIGVEPANDRKYIAKTHYRYEVSVTCQFYDQFFRTSPKKISVVNSANEQCYGHGAPTDGSRIIWCLRCNGSFGMGQLQDLMRRSMEFENMPKESIYHIEKTSTPISGSEINMAEAARLAKIATDRVVQLQTTIDGAAEKIRRLVEEMEHATQCDKEGLQRLLASHGSVDAFKEVMDAVVKKNDILLLTAEKNKLLNQRAKLEEEHQKLQTKVNQEQSTIENQRASVDKEMEELDSKLKTLGE